MYGEPCGTVSITASGYLITTTINTINKVVTAPDRILHIHLISGATASVLKISDGQTGAIKIQETGSLSTGADFDYGPHGITFPNGAYATVDGNIVSANITCRREQF